MLFIQSASYMRGRNKLAGALGGIRVWVEGWGFKQNINNFMEDVQISI